MTAWLHTTGLSARFARRSAIISLAIGAQAAYHLMTATGIHTARWPITVLVAGIPVLVLGLASAPRRTAKGVPPADAGRQRPR